MWCELLSLSPGLLLCPLFSNQLVIVVVVKAIIRKEKRRISMEGLCPPPPSTRQTETLHHHEWLYILGFGELLLLVLLRITFNIAVKFECIKNTQVFFLCFVSSFLFFCDPPDPDPIFFTSHTTSKGSDQSWRSGGGGGGGSSGNRSNSNA